MSAAKDQMNIWEQKYHDIMELYALSDELLSTVETAADPEAQLAMIEPLVETIGDSADVLSEEYIGLCEGQPGRKKTAKSRIEGALRKVYMSLHEFGEQAKDTKNAALTVVKRVKRQLEQVIANFVEFMTVSLDRIMQKNDVEELKARHANIALMLHQMSLNPAQ
jgi:hypothetical protein